MLRKLGVGAVIVLTLLTTGRASGQFSEPTETVPPTSEPVSSGRTPRQPRSSTTEADASAAPPPVGPGHSEEGAAPPAPVGVDLSRVRSHVTTDQRAVALTLDDGYRPDHRILGLIESYGIHGTAFLVGAVADSDPGLVNELARLGWLVCSHTYDHELLTGRSLEEIRSEMLRGIEAVERVVGYRCPYFRAPYGAVDANVVAVADELGLQLIGWETSISDSAPRGTDPDLQLEIAKRSLREGSIVLAHFGGTNSYDVLSSLLAWLNDEGYRIGSVAELIEGNVEAMAPDRGTAAVTVDVGAGAGQAAAVLPSRPTATRPWSLSAVEIALDMAGIVVLLLLARRRFGPRRHRRRRPNTLSEVLENTVPQRERDAVGSTPAPAVTVAPIATSWASITTEDAASSAPVTDGWT